MNVNQIKEKLKSDEYGFLNRPPLGKNVIGIALGGSYAYGTNTESSDIDIRGCALNEKDEILLGNPYQQVCDNQTDTTIYSLTKLVQLLEQCNPNTIEILGLKPEHYLYKTPIFDAMIENKSMFLSRAAINTFGGYANAQLHRLQNISARHVPQSENETYILGSINNARYTFPQKYFPMSEDDYINLYIDDAVNEELDKEIFMDVSLHHYPLRDYTSMWSEMKQITKDYGKLGSRNSRAVEHHKIAKHMMHLVRLYYMAIDILERGQIVTYRENEHDILMSIRNGEYLDENEQPTQSFFDLVGVLESRMKYSVKNTELPVHPDRKRIRDFILSVNESIVKGTAWEGF